MLRSYLLIQQPFLAKDTVCFCPDRQAEIYAERNMKKGFSLRKLQRFAEFRHSFDHIDEPVALADKSCLRCKEVFRGSIISC